MGNFERMLLSQVDTVETEPEILKLAEELKGISIFSNLTDEEYNQALLSAIRTIQVSIGESFLIEGNAKHVLWFEKYYKELGITRWDRYVDYLKNQKKMPLKVIQNMKEGLFRISDLLGDPNGSNFQRKGLIVGDVQSGKTANYVGLMNLATDAKYKIIIVLTGTTNTLREQTQIRIEEGLGLNKLPKGVASIKNAYYKDFINPVYLTSRENDFNISSKKNFQISIESTTVPIVIVTKKNPTSLKNIFNWLENYSKKQGYDHIDSSLLLIDDEADFASVNVNKEELNPTVINSKIRDILNLFTKSSYIGYTATPYANIFIDPQNDDEMFGQDLFPKDYIFVLGESDEYVGVQSIFSNDKLIARHQSMLVKLNADEVATYLPLKHKKTDHFTTLSPSMIDAINLFFAANAIRDIRGDITSHRSMLMNMSRFINFHDSFKEVVTEYVDKVRRDVKLYGKLPLSEALKNESISSLQNTFNRYYSDLDDNITFSDILSIMNDSIYRIKVVIVNANNKELDYLLNEKEGERVIVIGGFALSRGLTLEGLMISYYYRNSVMYDSLLQMGRWFGYRAGYADLCKIFMTQKVMSDFNFIAMATQELKDDLEINSKRVLTPKEFGIKVRRGQAGLIITARSKMRSGKKITANVDFSRDIIETTTLSVLEKEINNKNHKLIERFINSNKSKFVSDINYSGRKPIKGLINIDKSAIIEFLKDYHPINVSSNFDSDLIIKWLRQNDSKIIQKWDIAFINGSSPTKYDYGNGISGYASGRTLNEIDEIEGIYKNSNSRLGSPTDGKIGLTDYQVEIVKRNHPNSDTISQKEYFDQSISRKPILLIYSVVGKNETLINMKPISLLSVGIPDLGIGKSKNVDYTVNKIYVELDELEIEEE